jgi:hypothetical protein
METDFRYRIDKESIGFYLSKTIFAIIKLANIKYCVSPELNYLTAFLSFY